MRQSVQFGYKRVLYSVHANAVRLGDAVIQLPDRTYLLVAEAVELDPPFIVHVEETRLLAGQEVFEAVVVENPAHFRYGACFYMAAVPEGAMYFDGTLIRLPNGELIAWGSLEESMTPRMETRVSRDDPCVLAAGDRIYDAVDFAKDR